MNSQLHSKSTSFGLALAMTLVMLAGINALAQSQPTPQTLARAGHASPSAIQTVVLTPGSSQGA